MIHPNTELKLVNEAIGYGVFATNFIPEGTMVYVKDSLEQIISPSDYHLHSKEMREIIDKYSYTDENGFKIVSWDFAKYVNHCCNCNTMSTGYGFEIAIQDIQPGDQITDEYGLFNMENEMEVVCGQEGCRRRIGPGDFDANYKTWDEKIRKSLGKFFSVEQPLITFLDDETRKNIDLFNQSPDTYKSVYQLKLQPLNGVAGQLKLTKTFY